MSQPLLSILIPTVVGREDCFNKLYSRLQDLSHGMSVEIRYMIDDKSMTIGEKRERLYNEACGIYSFQIDDDDDVSDDFFRWVMRYIPYGSPCITFMEKCLMNDNRFTSNHSIAYDKWQDNFDGYDFVRCPFYKDLILTEIAKSVPFPRTRWNEDEQWSMKLKPSLTGEIHIPYELYIYQYNNNQSHNERYGIQNL